MELHPITTNITRIRITANRKLSTKRARREVNSHTGELKPGHGFWGWYCTTNASGDFTPTLSPPFPPASCCPCPVSAVYPDAFLMLFKSGRAPAPLLPVLFCLVGFEVGTGGTNEITELTSSNSESGGRWWGGGGGGAETICCTQRSVAERAAPTGWGAALSCWREGGWAEADEDEA